MRKPTKNECRGLGKALGVMVTTSTRSEDVYKMIPIHKAYELYLDSNGLSREILKDTHFQNYFLAYILLKDMLTISVVRSVLGEEKEIYTNVVNECSDIVESSYGKLQALVKNTEIPDLLIEICQGNDFELMSSFSNFYMFLSGDLSEENSVYYKDFFENDLKQYRELLIKTHSLFMSNPEKFADKSGCTASFILFTLFMGASIGTLLFVI